MRSRPVGVLQRLGLCLLLLVLYSSFKLLLLTNEGVSSSPEDVQAVQKHEDTTPGSTSKPKHDLSINDTAYLHCPGPLQQVPPTLRELCPTCPQYTCSHFLLNPHTHPDHKKAKSLQEKYTLHKVPEADYIKLTENCTAFKSSNKYTLHPADEEEGNYSIAFNILMHKDVEQVERLLRAIYRPQNFYCIHVDGKSPNVTLSAMRAITKCFPNVILASKMERVVYAGQSRLQADINCMSDLVKHSNQWKYLINVAGQAFPLKTNSEMVKILKIYNGANDIEGIYGKRVLRSRFLNEWLEVDVNTSRPTMKKTGKQNPPTPFDIDIVRGSAYGVFSREFVEFLLNDKKARALLTWSKHTWSPDEHYWATLHHTYSNPHINAPGSYKGMPNEKPWLAVYAAWGGVDSCQGRWKHGVCVFGLGDLPNLIKRKEFFANKFYYDLQPAAFECMEAWLRHKLICAPPFNSAYYQSLPFIKPKS